MTDPVDTDALRTWNDGKVSWDDIDAGWTSEAQSAISALCDEVERLRGELAEGLAITKQHAKDGAHERRLLERDAHRLRAVIENAPHDSACNCSTYRVEGAVQTIGCTCWKADVL